VVYRIGFRPPIIYEVEVDHWGTTSLISQVVISFPADAIRLTLFDLEHLDQHTLDNVIEQRRHWCSCEKSAREREAKDDYQNLLSFPIVMFATIFFKAIFFFAYDLSFLSAC
jgi:hypothetical protein